MKIERWNKDSCQFEVVELKPEEFDEMFIYLSIAEAECLIEERMELLREELYENIPDYD